MGKEENRRRKDEISIGTRSSHELPARPSINSLTPLLTFLRVRSKALSALADSRRLSRWPSNWYLPATQNAAAM